VSLRSHFDAASISLRCHLDFTLISLRVHLLGCPFGSTSLSQTRKREKAQMGFGAGIPPYHWLRVHARTTRNHFLVGHTTQPPIKQRMYNNCVPGLSFIVYIPHTHNCNPAQKVKVWLNTCVTMLTPSAMPWRPTILTPNPCPTR
jgi:hypothetical protein